MSITARSVYRDTKNFYRNQFIAFLLIAFLCAFITVMLYHVLSPSKEQIAMFSENNYLKGNNKLFELVQNMTSEQQKILLNISISSTVSGLIGNTILAGSVLLLIQSVSAGHYIGILRAIKASIPTLPKLFVLVFLTTLLVQIGIVLFIIPGILLAAVFSFSPIIVIQDKVSIFSAMCDSAKIAWVNMNLVFPAIMSWFLGKTLLLLLAANFIVITPNFSAIITSMLGNLISTMLLVYLFRLHMLLNEQ